MRRLHTLVILIEVALVLLGSKRRDARDEYAISRIDTVAIEFERAVESGIWRCNCAWRVVDEPSAIEAGLLARRDPWERPWRVRCCTGRVEAGSSGADETWGTDDDITWYNR